MNSAWVFACPADELEKEDVIGFEHHGRKYAVYRDEDGDYFASDGLCTHEGVELCDGIVLGNIIECPRHQGRFDVRNGKALGSPVYVDLKTYRVRVEREEVQVLLPE